MQKMQLVVSMRLHTLIFASSVGTPLVALSYDPKDTGFMRYIGQKHCIDFADVTLHVGLGGFRDVEVEDLTKHKMDSEQMNILQPAVDRINRAKDSDHQILAVGTTVVRALESAVSTFGHITPYDGWTNKFIFPPYEFQVPTSLVTNFHLSLSTMLMLVCAFGGYQQVMDVHNLAIREGYRIGPYGDSLLII